MARRKSATDLIDTEAVELPQATTIMRVAWAIGVMAWLFVFTSLASFDSADWPSHVVAVHNQPAANLCGPVGAMIAYWSYTVIGAGVWVILGGIAGYLGVIATGRVVGHPLVRTIGLLIMAAAVSSLHQLVIGGVGPLGGVQAGMLATWIVSHLGERVSGMGTFLVLLSALGVGAIVAIDWLVLALPRAFLAVLRAINAVRHRHAARIAALRARPDPALAADEPGPLEFTRRRRKRKFEIESPISADAGGIGATQSFDPDEHIEDDESQTPEEANEAAVASEALAKRARLSTDELKAKIAKLPLRMAGRIKTLARDEDIPREASFEGYQFPTLDLLEEPEGSYSEKLEQFVRDQAQQLEEALQTYGIDGEVVGIESGPVVTLYSVQLVPGTKVAKVQTVASDIARNLKAQNIRIVPNMVGKTTVGIEVPNPHKEKVRLKELMSGGHSGGMMLPMFLGKDASGEPLVADLADMPHMLIAGTTGSGKSVCMNTIIMSWMYTKRPDELKLILVDPKMVEMSQFQEIPHLMCPVVTEMSKAMAIMDWAVNKMEERYELLREAGVRDLKAYNTLGEEELYERFQPQNELEKAKIPKKMPYIVVVIDELADLIMTHREVEHSIVRIAQKARAVGIHLILATQRPQATVVTGLIKSNMPSRISFKVASGMDSRIVLDSKGAELLLGQGDMLFLTPRSSELNRAQGTLVTDSEIRRVAKFLKNVAAPSFERSLINIRLGASDEEDAEGLSADERDPMFEQAVEIMIESGRGSVSLLQRRLAIGYTRASRLVDQMGRAGILGEHKGSVAREVIITMEEWEQMQEMERAAQADGTLFQDPNASAEPNENGASTSSTGLRTALKPSGVNGTSRFGDPPVIETIDEDEDVPAEFPDEYRM